MAGFRILLYLLEYPLLVRLDLIVGLTSHVGANLLVVTPVELNCLKESFFVLVSPEIGVPGRCWWLYRCSFEFLLLGNDGIF